ncbi:MAG TPA: flagellar hook-basal body complex protein FliE [Ferrovibrio sp.]|uniref:flagellar hook-basal body complex protein FliE n=1 Tax=Ferrovibrio sp. TaxID=1917215 RepID=UPI002B4AEE3E|nr:flagellar hook-basal body complex protein FliE [Ferrovibrio sp.]HLT76210.1 flagellar hook-basal body complex protein FliE [Ferrovibrio sp.]
MADLTIGSRIAGLAPSLGAGSATQAKPAQGFGEMLTEALQNTVDASRASEAMASQAVAGKADVTDVVTAVTNAEMALDTVVSIRDKVISAYQEILRMPI